MTTTDGHTTAGRTFCFNCELKIHTNSLSGRCHNLCIYPWGEVTHVYNCFWETSSPSHMEDTSHWHQPEACFYNICPNPLFHTLASYSGTSFTSFTSIHQKFSTEEVCLRKKLLSGIFWGGWGSGERNESELLTNILLPMFSRFLSQQVADYLRTNWHWEEFSGQKLRKEGPTCNSHLPKAYHLSKKRWSPWQSGLPALKINSKPYNIRSQSCTMKVKYSSSYCHSQKS